MLWSINIEKRYSFEISVFHDHLVALLILSTEQNLFNFSNISKCLCGNP